LESAADAKRVGDWMVARWSLHDALPARVSTMKVCARPLRSSIPAPGPVDDPGLLGDSAVIASAAVFPCGNQQCY